MKKSLTMTLFAGLFLINSCTDKALSKSIVGDEKYLHCVQQENNYMIQYSWEAPSENGCCGKGAIKGVKEIWKQDEGQTRMLVSSEPINAKEIQKKFCAKTTR